MNTDAGNLGFIFFVMSITVWQYCRFCPEIITGQYLGILTPRAEKADAGWVKDIAIQLESIHSIMTRI